ncbi:MAG TPA: serine/threonine-protein kinase [Myxococcaceae bacterium]|nr:serine/threonine-protein kinase [Myxococcaceae bacterium]
MPLERELGGYEIVGRLAVGGMAEVYQARPLPSTSPAAGEGPEVVLKRLLPAYRNDGAHVKHFIDEAKIAVRLQHKHLVRTFRCFKSGADYLMVQELVPGRTLGYFLELLIQSGTPMPLPAANYIGWCLLDALGYLHGGIGASPPVPLVHRDVNPSNVLLSVTGDVKLTDFGIAEFDGFPRAEQGALRGTVAYMSPEQVVGDAIDARSDLYSVGIILWELVANRRLFPQASELDLLARVRDAQIPLLEPLRSGVPEYLARVVRQATFADRDRRFQSAPEFARALQLVARRNGWPLTVEALNPLLGR